MPLHTLWISNTLWFRQNTLLKKWLTLLKRNKTWPRCHKTQLIMIFFSFWLVFSQTLLIVTVSWSADWENQNPNSHCSSKCTDYSSFLKSAVLCWTALKQEAREERVSVESSGITSQTAIKCWFHSLSHFHSVVVFTTPNLNRCFKSERWCEWTEWQQWVKVENRRGER